MPFLFPAVAAGVSDALILILSNSRRAAVAAIVDEKDDSLFPSGFHVGYLPPLAVLRLILLLAPLPYHSYTGTAIRYSSYYQLLYGLTICAVILHMLVIIMVAPESLLTIIPALYHGHSSTDGGASLSPEMATIILSRSCWWMLFLSLTSVSAHIVMLVHVRSTAPPESYYDTFPNGQRRKKLLTYYASRKVEDAVAYSHGGESPILSDRKNGRSGSVGDAIILSTTHPREESAARGKDALNKGEQVAGHLTPLKTRSSQYDYFLHEMQTRINTYKSDWTKKLDDFTHRHLPENTTRHPDNPLLPLTPFRVLLQLFAYQDVIDSGKLDKVFDMDEGQAITFFVPQLLSFLLYGAYYETAPNKLEEWILDKCSKHIYFAHRCFWFLRAWCLEDRGGIPNPSSMASLQLENSKKDIAVSPSHSRSNSVSSLTKANGSTTKLLPEERELVENLLLRVVQAGEMPARRLQYGSRQETPLNGAASVSSSKTNHRGKRDKSYQSVDVDDDAEVSNLLAASSDQSNGFYVENDVENNVANADQHFSLTPEMEASLPVDPDSGFPSMRHLATLTASRRYGFMPLASSPRETSQPDEESSELFQMTPNFLESLLDISDGLFLVPKEHRKLEFRRQLRRLELETLPSNAVYVPISNVYHRVWRIVPEESIALGTKERVPCIVCLEVVDYSVGSAEEIINYDAPTSPFTGKRIDSMDRLGKKNGGKRSLELPQLGVSQKETISNGDIESSESSRSSSPILGPHSDILHGKLALPFLSLNHYQPSEADIVNQWRFAKRNPHRGESILDKMTSSLQLDILRMRDRIDQIRDKQGAIFQDFIPMTIPNLEEEQRVLAGNNELDIGGETKEEMHGNSLILEKKGSGISASSVGSAENDRDSSPVRTPIPEMGQWSSPTVSKKKTVDSQVGRDVDDATADAEPGLPMAASAAYGSTYSERRTIRSKKGRPPLAFPGAPSIQPVQKSAAKPPAVVFRENWQAKEERLRSKSAFGDHPGWRLLPIMIKANDDLRQEQLASQLIYRMAFILAREHIPVWLCPYEIIAVTDSGGVMEAIKDTISLDSLKRNDANYTDLRSFFHSYFGGSSEELADAKMNFVESLAAYSIATFLLQIKDRHNGNILLDNLGHIIHIDFGFFFLSSPGQNTGFESAPFKLTREFVGVLDGPDSHLFKTFRELCFRSFIALRKHCMELILLVEMLKLGNEDLNCFRCRPDDAIRGLRERFRLDLSDRACREYVNALVDESLENWRTNWYDRYQRYCVGVL